MQLKRQPSSEENSADAVVTCCKTKEMCPGRIELQTLPVGDFRCIFLLSSRVVIFCRNILWDYVSLDFAKAALVGYYQKTTKDYKKRGPTYMSRAGL